MTSHRIEAITDEAVVVSGEAGRRELPYDYAFCCLGLRAKPIDATVCEELTVCGIQLLCIGDSKQPRLMYDGILEGRNVIERLKAMGYYENN
mgnify:FL=1